MTSLAENSRPLLDIEAGSAPDFDFEESVVPNYRAIATAMVGIATAIRFVSVANLPLGNGEAYYYTWSQFLDWSYCDHPPLIAWLVRLTTMLGTSSATVRLGPILACGAFGLLFHRLAERLIGARAALFALMIVSALPVFLASSFIVNPEAPLAPLWVGYLLVIESMRRSERRTLPILAGALLGAAFLAKYTALLLVPATLLYVVSDSSMRRWLARPSFYLGGAVALIFASPVLFWNSLHGWATIQLHLVERVKVGVPAAGENTINHLVEISSSNGATFLARLGRLLVGQMMSYSPLLAPLLVLAIVWALVGAVKRDGRGLFLSAFTWPVLVPLLGAMSMLNNAEQHWTMVAFIPAAIGAGYLAEIAWTARSSAPLTTGSFPRFAFAGGLFPRVATRTVNGLFAAGIGLSATAFVAAHCYVRTPSIMAAIPGDRYDPHADMVNELIGWDQVRAGIAQAAPVGNYVLASNQASLCGRLFFETSDSPAVYCPVSGRSAFDFFNRRQPPADVTVLALTSDIHPEIPAGLEGRKCGAPESISIERGGRQVAEYFLRTCEPSQPNAVTHEELRASRDK